MQGIAMLDSLHQHHDPATWDRIHEGCHHSVEIVVIHNARSLYHRPLPFWYCWILNRIYVRYTGRKHTFWVHWISRDDTGRNENILSISSLVPISTMAGPKQDLNTHQHKLARVDETYMTVCLCTSLLKGVAEKPSLM